MATDTAEIMDLAGNNLDKFMAVQNGLRGTGYADNNQIKIVLSGHMNIAELKLAPETVKKHSAEDLSRLLITAFNRARADLDTQLKEATRKLVDNQ